jgi:hypothetical protein
MLPRRDRAPKRVLGGTAGGVGGDEGGGSTSPLPTTETNLDLRGHRRDTAGSCGPRANRAKQPVSFVISTLRAPSSAMCSRASAKSCRS